MLGLFQAIGVSPNKMTAWRACFLGIFFSPAVYELWLSYTELSWNAQGVAFMTSVREWVGQNKYHLKQL